MQRGTMKAPDQDTGLALGVWPQLSIVSLERFCRPRETDKGLWQVEGHTLCPSAVFNASKYSRLSETLKQTCFILGMSRKRAAMSFPICKVFQAGNSNGAEEAVGKSCRLAAEPSHLLTHLHIKAHSSSTNEQLAQESRRGASVDLHIGWIVLRVAWIPQAWTPLQSPPYSSQPLMDRLNQ